MKIVADLHIHSHYSRATSKHLDFEHLFQWAQFKGVNLLGTGDIAHPGWLAEMQAKLEPAEEGLFQLKPEVARAVTQEVPAGCRRPVRFMLAGEISNIYKRHDKVRKVHNVIFAPTLDAVERIQARLEQIGNIRADGRPILGLDSRDLLEIILEVDSRCHLIPAHIWTPWFSMLGSKSGFDTVEECFGDLTHHIFALETGLSSDPPMNRRLSMLDQYVLVSSSDAHSPQKLAREATLFDTEPSYDAIFAALQSGDPAHFRGTVEFFPEEGKYHHDGHRKCGINWEPKTTLAHNGICPVCGKPVTVGVSHRVETLADRSAPAMDGHPPFLSLIPLPEVLSELCGVGPNSKRVQQEYFRLLDRLGPELEILQELPLAEIKAGGGDRLAEAIDRMRRGLVSPMAGYDGEYGVIKLFGGGTEAGNGAQMALLDHGAPPHAPAVRQPDVAYHATQTQATANDHPSPTAPSAAQPAAPAAKVEPVAETETPPGSGWGQVDLFGAVIPVDAPPVDDAGGTLGDATGDTTVGKLLAGLNPAQRAAATDLSGPLLIVAGPGTGKTRTLTHRLAYLLAGGWAGPTALLAITFTNKAAGEMQERLTALVGPDLTARMTVKTFHAFGAQLLATHGAAMGLPDTFTILSEPERLALLARHLPDAGESARRRYLDAISAAKNCLLPPHALTWDIAADAQVDPVELAAVYTAYEAALAQSQALDFDDLIFRAVQLLEEAPAVLEQLHDRYRWIAVDEYQDVNYAQVRLLRLLTAGGANLCVIGDPDQAIYGFRGADRSYFLRFTEENPAATVLHLDRNYRSSTIILDAAQQVIACSPNREALRIWSDFVSQTRLEIYTAPTDKAEAEYVVHQIEQMVGGTSYFSIDSGRVGDDGQGRSFADFGVLYRTGAQLPLLTEAFERSGIPFQSVGRTPLTARPEIRKLLAYLWLVETSTSTVHLERALADGRTPMAATLVDALVARARTLGVDPWQVDHPELTPPRRAQLAAVGARVESLRARRGAPVADLVAQIWQATVPQEDAISQTPPAPDEFVRRLGARAETHGSDLRAFLETTVLAQETDAYDPRADRVALMTLHAAKGLEFPVVFVAGCEDGLLPYRRDAGDPLTGEALDEERRLFYVGMTRAREKLILTRARRRFLFGRSRENAQSPFVDDIESTLKDLKNAAPLPPREEEPSHRQLSLF